MPTQEHQKKGRVAIIGGGWYGAHVALALQKLGFKVTLLEKGKDIFTGISGKFGVRLHAGPHYPRSSSTRESCHQGFDEFCKTYPELTNPHEYSIYGLGTRDANNNPPKVTKEQFKQVCKESKGAREIDVAAYGYQNLSVAYDIPEPSIVVGVRLRNTFKELLQSAGVKVRCNFNVTTLEKLANNKILIIDDKQEFLISNYIINTTSYQSLLPTHQLHFKMDVVYQPCLALVYKDTITPPPKKPLSWIVMDGWFPCLMPYDDRPEKTNIASRKYILTHGKWTIMGSYKTSNEAHAHLATVDEAFINSRVRPHCEEEITKFWPEFTTRFRYIKWVGAVLAKIKTDREFRSAVVFQHQVSGMIFVFPGKVSNIFDAEREVLSLIKNENVIHKGDYCYAKNGVLDDAKQEIEEVPKDPFNNTCELQTFRLPTPTNIKDVNVYKKMQGDHNDNHRKSVCLLTLAFLSATAISIVNSSKQENGNLLLEMLELFSTCALSYFISSLHPPTEYKNKKNRDLQEASIFQSPPANVPLTHSHCSQQHNRKSYFTSLS